MVFFSQANSKAPKVEQVFPYLFVTINRFFVFCFCFVCCCFLLLLFCCCCWVVFFFVFFLGGGGGLIHYEADVTVWKSSIDRVDA